MQLTIIPRNATSWNEPIMCFGLPFTPHFGRMFRIHIHRTGNGVTRLLGIVNAWDDFMYASKVPAHNPKGESCHGCHGSRSKSTQAKKIAVEKWNPKGLTRNFHHGHDASLERENALLCVLSCPTDRESTMCLIADAWSSHATRHFFSFGLLDLSDAATGVSDLGDLLRRASNVETRLADCCFSASSNVTLRFADIALMFESN